MIEGLRAGDLRGRRGHVGRLVDDHRHVAGTDAERRRAAFVRRAHVGLRAGRDDEIRLAHQRIGQLAGDGRRQLQHEIARRPDPVELGVHEFQQQRQCRLSFRRRREDDRVAPLERIDDVVRRRRAGIGRRRDRRDDADRPRDLDEAARGVRADDAHRLRALEIAQQADRLAPVLRDLVGDVTQPGVAHRAFGERAVAAGLHDRPRGGGHRFVDALLRPGLELALRGAGPRDERGCDGVRRFGGAWVHGDSARAWKKSSAHSATPTACARKPSTKDSSVPGGPSRVLHRGRRARAHRRLAIHVSRADLFRSSRRRR